MTFSLQEERWVIYIYLWLINNVTLWIMLPGSVGSSMVQEYLLVMHLVVKRFKHTNMICCLVPQSKTIDFMIQNAPSSSSNILWCFIEELVLHTVEPVLKTTCIVKTSLQTHKRAFSGEGIVALYAVPNPFLLYKMCLNQNIFIHCNSPVLRDHLS